MSNEVLLRLRQGLPVVGTSLTIPHEFVAELVGQAGFDFILIDMQHTPIGVETFQRLMIALHPTNSTVIARTWWNDPAAIGQVLDLGADGVVVPMVNTAEDAQRAVSAALYPPDGNRSWGPRRAARLRGGPEQYARQANENTLILPQVETEEAVRNLDRILAVPGITGIMIGPSDLANSLGYSHDRNHPTVRGVMDGVLERCQQRGMPFGQFAQNIESARDWIDRGALIAVCGGDVSFIIEGIARSVGGSPLFASRRPRRQPRARSIDLMLDGLGNSPLPCRGMPEEGWI